jgi:hypothetical protein
MKSNATLTRRDFILDSALFAAASQLDASAESLHSMVAKVPGGRSAVNPVVAPQTSTFSPADVRLLDGPFKQSRDAVACYLLSLDVDRLLAPYRVEAGLKAKAPQYPGWETRILPGVALGFYLSGTSRLAAGTMSAGANVWSTALLQAKSEVGKLVRANVFGLCWRIALSGPRWDALRSVPI